MVAFSYSELATRGTGSPTGAAGHALYTAASRTCAASPQYSEGGSPKVSFESNQPMHRLDLARHLPQDLFGSKRSRMIVQLERHHIRSFIV